MTVFLSHSSRDGAAVGSLVQHLEGAGKTVWLDQQLTGGDAWWSAILKEIRDCELFVFALSENSLRSEPCRSEFEYASALGLPILPVQIGDVDSFRSASIFTRQAIDYRNPTVTTGIALSRALQERTAQRSPLPDPLPPAPPIPYEYLQKLGQVIDGRDPISPTDQVVLLTQLRQALHDEHDESVQRDVRNLLQKLRARSETTHGTATEIDNVLQQGAAPGAGQIPGQAASGASPQLGATPSRDQGSARHQPSSQPPQSTPPRPVSPKAQPKGRRGRAKLVLIATLVVAVVAAIVVAYFVWSQPSSTKTQTAQPAASTAKGGAQSPSSAARTAPQAPTSGPAAQPTSGSGLTQLPFAGLHYPAGVAVDSAGNVYVVEGDEGRVHELAAGATTSVPLPFKNDGVGPSVAVDAAGTVYAVDGRTSTIWKLPPGAGTPDQVQFPDVRCGPQNTAEPVYGPRALAVDGPGNMFISDLPCGGRVLSLPTGSSTATLMPFVDAGTPAAIAVDAAGDVFVTDNQNPRVLELKAGTSRPMPLPFTGLKKPSGIAIDSSGNVFVSDASLNTVFKLAAGSTTQTEVPLTDLSDPPQLATPQGLAVDTAGNLYICDHGHGRVLKVPGA